MIITDHKKVRELGGADPNTTNNRMEMTAIMEALRFISSSDGEVTICTDSTYVIRGITQWVFGWKKRGWKNAEGKEVLNKDLWIDFDKLMFKLKNNFKFQWKYVPGHSNVVGNERCDEIAVAFSQGLRPYLYDGDLSGYGYPIDIVPPDFALPEMKSNNKKTSSKPTFYLSLVDGVLLKHQTWPECQNRVKGRSGAKFKKATSDDEAKSILKGWGLSPSRWDEL